MTIKTQTLWRYYEDAKAEFKSVEKKEFSHLEGLSQCNTKKGIYFLGQIVTFIKLIEEDAN
jgi:hypothetical protein|tara:strand:- start:1382 stop:1564 length:183 start_codon:yes stop_codon:yes gene_type:complete